MGEEWVPPTDSLRQELMSPLAWFSLCLIQTKSAQKNQRGHRIGEVLHFKLVFQYWDCTGEMVR